MPISVFLAWMGSLDLLSSAENNTLSTVQSTATGENEGEAKERENSKFKKSESIYRVCEWLKNFYVCRNFVNLHSVAIGLVCVYVCVWHLFGQRINWKHCNGSCHGLKYVNWENLNGILKHSLTRVRLCITRLMLTNTLTYWISSSKIPLS